MTDERLPRGNASGNLFEHNMSSKHNFRRRRRQNDEFARTKYITQFVDAAIAPLGRYLNGWQAKLVRSIVEATIEVDPVSRRLLANVLRSRLRAQAKASSAERDGDGPKSDGPNRAARTLKK